MKGRDNAKQGTEQGGHKNIAIIPKEADMPPKSIEQSLNEKTSQWMAIPGVVGTAIGVFKDRPCIKVYTTLSPHKLRDKLPSTVDGYPVIIEETGSIHSLGQD